MKRRGGLIAGTGNLNLNGTVNAGTGAITLISGINGTRPSYTMNATNFTAQSTFGAIAITGFLDFTINRNLTSTSSIGIITQRDLTLNSGMTITPGSASTLNLQAANASTTGTGNLNINGNHCPKLCANNTVVGYQWYTPIAYLNDSKLRSARGGKSVRLIYVVSLILQ